MLKNISKIKFIKLNHKRNVLFYCAKLQLDYMYFLISVSSSHGNVRIALFSKTRTAFSFGNKCSLYSFMFVLI